MPLRGPPAIMAITAEVQSARSIGSIERGLVEILLRRFSIEGVLNGIPSAPDYDLMFPVTQVLILSVVLMSSRSL